MSAAPCQQAAQRGDARACAALVRMHQRSLSCTAYSILGSSWDANDAVPDEKAGDRYLVDSMEADA